MNWGRIYIAAAGVIGVATGVLGFVDNAFVGDPANDAIFATDGLHNVIHIGTGVLALYIGLALSGTQQARGIIGFGLLYLRGADGQPVDVRSDAGRGEHGR